jgi:hypothetical protein
LANFGNWVIVYVLRAVYRKLQKYANNFVYFFHGKIYLLILTKMGWATFWATSSQTYLVTLVTMRHTLGLGMIVKEENSAGKNCSLSKVIHSYRFNRKETSKTKMCHSCPGPML